MFFKIIVSTLPQLCKHEKEKKNIRRLLIITLNLFYSAIHEINEVFLTTQHLLVNIDLTAAMHCFTLFEDNVYSHCYI